MNIRPSTSREPPQNHFQVLSQSNTGEHFENPVQGDSYRSYVKMVKTQAQLVLKYIELKESNKTMMP